MKPENSYQKLSNEDTLSTISFTPPVQKNTNKKWLTKKSIVLGFIGVATLLLTSYFVLGVHISCFHSKKTGYTGNWHAYRNGDVEVPKLTYFSCPELTPSDAYKGKYRDSVEMRLHRMLTKDISPPGYENSVTLNMVKNGYQSCRTGEEHPEFVDEMVETVFSDLNDRSGVPEKLALLQTQFNLETFFKVQVMANYQDPDGHTPYVVYLSPNTEFIRPLVNFTNWSDTPLNFENKLARYLNLDWSFGSLDWRLLDLNTPKNFDFKIYFKTLFQELSETNINVNKIRIVDTNPAATELLLNAIENVKFESLKNFLQKYLKSSFLNDFDNCVHAIEKYVPNAATVMYLATFEENEVRSVRNAFLKKFEDLIAATEDVVKPLLTAEQAALAHERLQKVGLTTEEPDWLQLSDSPMRFDELHKNLRIKKNSEGLVALIRMRIFAFQKSIQHLKSKDEAVRIAAFEGVSMSDTEMGYSMIGNWLNVPVASFMDIDEDNVVLQLAIQMAKIVDVEGFYWSAYGTQRHNLDAHSLQSRNIMESDIFGQNTCFTAHGLPKQDHSIIVGLEAAYRVLLKHGKHPFAQVNLLTELTKKLTADRNIPKLRIAAGFLEHMGRKNVCEVNNVLPCYLENAVSKKSNFQAKYVSNHH